MSRIILLLNMVLLIFSHKILPQNPAFIKYLSEQSFKVDAIKIIGNDVTEEDIILRELTFGIGDTVNKRVLIYNRERIYSLGIFTKVQLYPDFHKSKTFLIIYVEESWYIYPLPVVELRDRDWKKFSYGLDLILQNFRGRNEVLRGRAVFGYDPAFLISYYNPYLVRKDDISFGIDLIYQDANNKSSIAALQYGRNFSQKFIIGQVSFGKRFGLYNRIGISASYNYIETPFYIYGINASDGRVDKYVSLGLGYSYDTRDLIQFPKNGLFGSIGIQFKGFGIDEINYQVLNTDFREYRNLIGDLISKWRITTRHAFGELVPTYENSFIGYGERIRGHFNKVREGHNYYIGSLEFFYPIIRDLNISLDFIPVFPAELLSYRVALYLQLFGDTGAAKLRHSSLGIHDFDTGFGTGLTLLILPYNIARVELAFDENLRPEWIFDLGVSF